MSRVLLLGTGGLPDDALSIVDFPRLRMWQFLRGMLEAGHEVVLISALAGLKETPRWKDARVDGHDLRVLRAPLQAFDEADLPSAWVDEVSPDVVVSAGPFGPARAAARVPSDIPVFIDLPGDLMAEAQLRARTTGDPAHLGHAHRVLTAALARGDAFSVVSERQRMALLGQLALTGRLTGERVGWSGVHTIPVGLEPLWSRWAHQAGTVAGGSGEKEAGAIGGTPVGGNAGAAGGPGGGTAGHVKRKPARVIWPGAVNTWADLETFFAACELAMAGRSDLEVVVTGGPIAGHEEQAWGRLERWIAGSPFRARWRLTGWIDPVSAAREVCEATVGVSLDVPCLEAVLGSRTRLLYGVALGLPWVTTPGCELADRLITLGLARGVPVGDAGAVARAILAGVEEARAAEGGVGDRGEHCGETCGENAGETCGESAGETCGESAGATGAAGIPVAQGHRTDGQGAGPAELELAFGRRIFADVQARVREEMRARVLEDHGGAKTVAGLVRWVEAPERLGPGIDLTRGLVERVGALERELAAVHSSPTWRVLGTVHRVVRGRK